MDNFGNAVKAFIVKDNRLLILKRDRNDPHKPGLWDQPGGRLGVGENPYDGIQRETREETGLEIEVITPLDVHFFVRDDGQTIQMTIFLCKIKSGEVKLSEEHTEYSWKKLSDPIEEFPKYFQCCVKKYRQFEFAKHLD